jgi:hypothetical protein
MAYRSFRQFLDDLEQAGELKRIAVPVDTDLLIAEWADREMKSPGGGKSSVFEQPLVDGKKSEFQWPLIPWDRAGAWPWRYRLPTLKMSRAKSAHPESKTANRSARRLEFA